MMIPRPFRVIIRKNEKLPIIEIIFKDDETDNEPILVMCAIDFIRIASKFNGFPSDSYCGARGDEKILVSFELKFSTMEGANRFLKLIFPNS